MKKILSSFLVLMTFWATARAECMYNNIAQELKNNCLGIHAELQNIKKYEIANVAVTGVGTLAAGGALAAGIKKKDLDKKAAELETKLKNIQNMSDADFMKFLKDMAAYTELKTEYTNVCKQKRLFQSNAKTMGNLRTGLMAGNTATAIAGTIIANKNKNDSKSIKDMIQQCLTTIDNMRQQIGQTMFDCERAQYDKLKSVVQECTSMETANMDHVSKQNNISSVVSGVNIGTGAAGTIVSALANKNTYDTKTKNLNTAANILAGTSMVASGVSTGFNVATLKSINRNLSASQECEGALNRL